MYIYMDKGKKEKLITAVVTFITTVLGILFLNACTMSMSVAKNNQGEVHQDQKQSTSVDSTKIINNLNK